MGDSNDGLKWLCGCGQTDGGKNKDNMVIIHNVVTFKIDKAKQLSMRKIYLKKYSSPDREAFLFHGNLLR